MKIQIDPLTLDRAKERGADEQEIIDGIETGFEIPAKHGRMGKEKIYEFKRNRLKKWYEQKRVEMYYVIEKDYAIIVIVYVFYGKWRI